MLNEKIKISSKKKIEKYFLTIKTINKYKTNKFNKF